MKPSIEDLVLAKLGDSSHAIWLKRWRQTILRSLAERLIGRIDFISGTIAPGWSSELDDPKRRALAVETYPEIKEHVIAALAADRSELNQAIVDGAQGYTKRRRSQMEQVLRNVVAELIQHPVSKRAIANDILPELWHWAADIIARQAHGLKSTGPRSSMSDIILHHHLLLCAFFDSCLLRQASSAEHALWHLSQGFGLRSTLVRIVENVAERGVRDQPPPLLLGSSRSVNYQGASLSGILAAVSAEHHRILAGDGIFHRFLSIKAPVQLPMIARARGITEDQVRRGREIIYREYEHTVLGYLALNAIDQLVTGWACRDRQQIFRANGQVERLPTILARLPTSQALRAMLDQLYDVKATNLRNRIMHGGLLLIESQRTEALAPLSGSSLVPRRSEYMPSSISAVLLECLAHLDQEIATTGGIAAQHLHWASSYWSIADESAAHHTGDNPSAFQLLPHDTSAKYLRAFQPSIKHFLAIGIYGCLTLGEDTLVGAMAVVLGFEVLYRATVQLLKISILRSDGHGHFEYRILDNHNLFSTDVVNALLAHLPPPERPAAESCLRIAARLRDAFAHGAINVCDQERGRLICRCVTDAIVILVRAGLHAMTREAAYYRWENLTDRQHGHDVADWLVAENEIAELIAQLAQGRDEGEMAQESP